MRVLQREPTPGARGSNLIYFQRLRLDWTSREARQEEEGGAHQSQQIVGFDWQGGWSVVASGVVGLEHEAVSERGRMGCS